MRLNDQLHAPDALTLGKEAWVTIQYKVGSPDGPCNPFGGETNLLNLSQILPLLLGLPTFSLFTIPTELSQLR